MSVLVPPIGVETAVHGTQETMLDHVSTVQDQMLLTATSVMSTPIG